MVALQAPPLTVRVGVIVGSPLFVGLEDALLCLGCIQSIAFADPLDPVGERRVNEHVQAAGITAQRIIGAPPDNNAVLLPGNLLDLLNPVHRVEDVLPLNTDGPTGNRAGC